MFPMHFIAATTEYNTADRFIPQPLFRKEFYIKNEVKSVKIVIGSLGYYELHINGKNITKGEMAPYRSAPTSFVYFDSYDIKDDIEDGENVLGVILGNGIQNSIEPTWNFNELPWASAPAVSYEIVIEYCDGETESIISDKSTLCTESAITFNDFHFGEHYDARLEKDGWDKKGFDRSCLRESIEIPSPTGEPRFCKAEPIRINHELKAADIFPYKDGYVYDFKYNLAGLCRLEVDGKAGQKIVTSHFEVLLDGKVPYFRNIGFKDDHKFQVDEYICKGEGTEVHVPRFTYHGFRYVYVTGITKEQATPSLLTYLVINSDIPQRGHFECDDDIINRLQSATVHSDFSNFHYFPTDCPHREKNGWTADAALSAEQMLLNMAPENSYREWIRNICKAMREDGALPGIVPTGGWGFNWGNGPAWDCVLVYLPYFTYKYRGDKRMFEIIAKPLMKYIIYLQTKRDERGLIAIGLGDWCQPGRSSGAPHTPLVVTDSIMTVDILNKAELVYDVLGLEEQKEYVQNFKNEMISAIREHLVDKENLVLYPATQTGQAMAIYYNIFTDEEKEGAVKRLVRLIKEDDNHMSTGVVGGRVLFRVLAENGEGELAYQMITRPDFPSYGNWIKQGTTTLWENFRPDHSSHISSRNHHFWGDISAWFYSYIGGIRVNPTGLDATHIDICPIFFEKINHAKATYDTVCGNISVEWTRKDGAVTVEVKAPDGIHGDIVLNGKKIQLTSGEWTI